MTDPVVRAAGGVVWREGADGVEVLLVHRPRYDDWTFPKGKLDPGEEWDAAAVREVFEETGVVPLLGRELASTDYRDAAGRPKRVRYWAMTPATAVAFSPNDEVSALRWLAPDEARALLSYRRDQPVLDSFTEATEQVPPLP